MKKFLVDILMMTVLAVFAGGGVVGEKSLILLSRFRRRLQR
jgi:hypothetical protein